MKNLYIDHCTHILCATPCTNFVLFQYAYNACKYHVPTVCTYMTYNNIHNTYICVGFVKHILQSVIYVHTHALTCSIVLYCCRYSCCGIVHDSHLILVGGVSWNCNSPHIIIIDLKELKWTSVRVRVSVVTSVRVRVSAVTSESESECIDIGEGECSDMTSVRGRVSVVTSESEGECIDIGEGECSDMTSVRVRVSVVT